MLLIYLQDLARTFPTHPYFQEGKAGRHEMRRILVAYSWRNPLVAYCQSLNYIVGLLLLFFSEEEAFWMLVVILEEILPANFYSPQLKGLRVDGRVFDDLLKERLPKLYTHFMLNDVDTVTFISGWFMRVYVDVCKRVAVIFTLHRYSHWKHHYEFGIFCSARYDV